MRIQKRKACGKYDEISIGQKEAWIENGKPGRLIFNNVPVSRGLMPAGYSG